MLFDKPTLPLSFKQWMFRERNNRIFIFVTILSSFFLFKIFDHIYQSPNFLPDSYSYIEAAGNNQVINIWPIGYSKFLRFVSVFNYTDTGLFFVQYFLLQLSILFFLLTIGFLLNPGKWVIWLIAVILLLNPLWLYIGNFVSSDAIFASLSLLWLTTLLWLLYDASLKLLLIHGIILFLVFTVRYNSLYYPIITVIVLFFGKSSISTRLGRLILVLTPVTIFICFNTWQYKKKTDTVQFSPFGGWQLAANALYMYSHMSIKNSVIPPEGLKELDRIARQHIDSLQKLPLKMRPDQNLGFYYLWGDGAPLKQFMIEKYKNDSTTSYLKRWSKMAPIYAQYGTWLIHTYPDGYFKYFVWPNLINYYVPPVEFLGIYNMGKDSVDVGAVQWFKYKTSKIKVITKRKEIKIANIFTYILPIINVLFFTGFLGFLFVGGFKKIPVNYKKVYALIVLIWFSNLLFSVLASPIVLRYQVFPFIYTVSFGTLFLSYVIKESSKNGELNELPVNPKIIQPIPM